MREREKKQFTIDHRHELFEQTWEEYIELFDIENVFSSHSTALMNVVWHSHALNSTSKLNHIDYSNSFDHSNRYYSFDCASSKGYHRCMEWVLRRENVVEWHFRSHCESTRFAEDNTVKVEERSSNSMFGMFRFRCSTRKNYCRLLQ